MGYTITFYAMEGQTFARQMRESPDELLAKVEPVFRQQAPDDDAAWNVFRDRATKLCRGELPADSDADDYYALCWLVEVASQRFQICGFEEFRHPKTGERVVIAGRGFSDAPPWHAEYTSEGDLIESDE